MIAAALTISVVLNALLGMLLYMTQHECEALRGLYARACDTLETTLRTQRGKP